MSIQDPYFKTIAFIPSDLEAQVAGMKISTIHAEASDQKPAGQNKKTNHWVFVCAIGGQRAIRIDPSPSGPNNQLVCVLSLQNNLITHDAIKAQSLETKNLTIGSLIGLIKAKKLDKYQFTADGQGCRFWIYSIVTMLQSEQRLNSVQEYAAFADAINKTWKGRDSQLTGNEATGIVNGRFLALEQ